MNDTCTAMPHRGVDTEALLSRYALRVAARLSEQAECVDHDIAQRLRFAREKALERALAKRAEVALAAAPVGHGAAGVLALGGGPRSSAPWWLRLAWVLPVLTLMAGLVLIQNQHLRAQVAAAAEIDFDLLSDELPPAAYGDPGFLEFLKAPRD